MAAPMLAHAIPFDDDIFAITLQLEEIEAQRERETGKWRADSPPDYALSFLDFETELEKALQLIEDSKIAHSIAQAVDTDAATLENVTLEEQQAHRDRNIALSLQDVDREDLGLADIVDNSVVDDTVSFVTWDDLKLNHTDRSASSADVESICESITSSFAGPSVPYALRQRQVLE